MRVKEQKNIIYIKTLKHVNSNIGLNFFIKRIINYWNQLLKVIFNLKYSNRFKIKLQGFIKFCKKGNLNVINFQLTQDSSIFLYYFDTICRVVSWFRLIR